MKIPAQVSVASLLTVGMLLLPSEAQSLASEDMPWEYIAQQQLSASQSEPPPPPPFPWPSPLPPPDEETNGGDGGGPCTRIVCVQRNRNSQVGRFSYTTQYPSGYTQSLPPPHSLLG